MIHHSISPFYHFHHHPKMNETLGSLHHLVSQWQYLSCREILFYVYGQVREEGWMDMKCIQTVLIGATHFIPIFDVQLKMLSQGWHFHWHVTATLNCVFSTGLALTVCRWNQYMCFLIELTVAKAVGHSASPHWNLLFAWFL